jgi:hypothetical protein
VHQFVRLERLSLHSLAFRLPLHHSPSEGAAARGPRSALLGNVAWHFVTGENIGGKLYNACSGVGNTSTPLPWKSPQRFLVASWPSLVPFLPVQPPRPWRLLQITLVANYLPD